MNYEINNDKLLDILPYFAQIGEKLQKDIQAAVESKENNTFKVIILILKNIKKVKPEIFNIISKVTGQSYDEVKEMNVMVTIAIFKKIFDQTGIQDVINFTAGQSSEN